VRVAGSTLTYSRLDLAEACRGLAELGFDAVDVGAHAGWAHVDPVALVGDVEATARRLRETLSGTGLEPVAINAGPAAADSPSEREQVRALAALADALGADVLTLPAGAVDDDDGGGRDAGTDGSSAHGADLERVRGLVAAAAPYDVTPTVETHRFQHTEDPSVALAYAERVDGLALTLDPAHFAAGPYWASDCYDALLSHVAHVHVRQAGDDWDAIQRPHDDPEGRLDLRRLVERLRETGYDAALSVEYIDSLDGVTPDAAAREARRTRERLVELL